jgi:hypothetical protein
MISRGTRDVKKAGRGVSYEDSNYIVGNEKIGVELINSPSKIG